MVLGLVVGVGLAAAETAMGGHELQALLVSVLGQSGGRGARVGGGGSDTEEDGGGGAAAAQWRWRQCPCGRGKGSKSMDGALIPGKGKNGGKCHQQEPTTRQ